MDIFVKLVAAGAIMGVLDFFWLGFIAKKLYYAEIGKLLLDKPNLTAAVVFYVIYVVGVVMFVINPALAKNDIGYALGMGALFGLVAYATYDLTNLATLKGFSMKIVVIDMIWGMALTAAVSAGTFFIVKLLA